MIGYVNGEELRKRVGRHARPEVRTLVRRVAENRLRPDSSPEVLTLQLFALSWGASLGDARDWAASPGTAATWPEDALRLEIRKGGGIRSLLAFVDEIEDCVAAVLLGTPKDRQPPPSTPSARRKKPATRRSTPATGGAGGATTVARRKDEATRPGLPSRRGVAKPGPDTTKQDGHAPRRRSQAVKTTKAAKAAKGQRRKVAPAWTPHLTPGQRIDALKKPITNVGPLKPWAPLASRPEKSHPDRPAGYSTTDWISSKS